MRAARFAYGVYVVFNEINMKKMYEMLFYSTIGNKPSYMSRDELVSNAYWFISLMNGVNLVSVLYLCNFIFDFSSIIFGRAFFLLLLGVPLIFNYYCFLRKGKKQILKEVERLSVQKKLKSKWFAIKYTILSILIMAMTALINNEDVSV